ncbi:DUF4175 family protein [Aristophania vespae]|uniref:DUF4175 family protein n=1 Tax=Aristophania vespae TaxID=2697033 RepID=A0A6P1N9Y7_9PROT|nr:DUF4175 family protein [Aristophania vespae]QHI95415.1 DUF4175 family protein [Aristophania vespae]
MAGLFSKELTRARLKAKRVIKLEQIWYKLCWPIFFILLWLLASLFHLPQKLPDIIHAILELLYFALLVFIFRYRKKQITPPTIDELDRVIERSTHLHGYPLSDLKDHPVTTEQKDAFTAQNYIWLEHQKRLKKNIKGLKVRAPRFFKNSGEALCALFFIFIVGFSLFHTAPESLLRLKAGFVPGMDDDAVPLAHVQAWIDPPSFTGAPTIFLQQNLHKIDAPILQGARFFAVITGSSATPHLKGAKLLHLKKLEHQSWKIEGRVIHTSKIALRMRGRKLAWWNIKFEKDLPPFIAWKEKAKTLKESWRTVISWEAEQANGLKSLQLVLTLPNQHPISGQKPRIAHWDLPLKGTPKNSQGKAILDLSSDPFAGQNVSAKLRAESVSGLVSETTPQTIKIAARPFHNALSRSLLDIRRRLALHEETSSQALNDLTLLSALPMPRDILVGLINIIEHVKHKEISSDLTNELWFLALYVEDRDKAGLNVAASMAEFRAAQQDVLLQINDMGEKHPSSIAQQEELHTRLERLKNALDYRMKLMFLQASQTGIIMPMPSEKGAPWQKLSHQIQRETVQGNIDKAKNYLAEMADMAEQMRQAQPMDLKSLSLQMQAKEEARDQYAALRDLIRKETLLLNAAHMRISSSQPKSQPQNQNISQLSTAELLRQLGITPPPTLTEAPTPEPQDPLLKQRFADERQENYQVQEALKTLTHILITRGKTLTHKENAGFNNAFSDMKKALQAIAQRHDHDSAVWEQKILEDLSQAKKDMKDNLKSLQKSSKGRLGFIPPPQSPQEQHQKNDGSSSSDQSSDQDDDDMDDDKDGSQSKNRDPLGRKLDEGTASDAHIPDSQKNKNYKLLEQELRRRASDQTRPKAELDYLNRLLRPFSHPDL